MRGNRPGVLMVTGAYFPELSGAGLQCRTLVQALRDRVAFSVLTTTTDPALPAQDERDGIPVRRVFVDPSSPLSKAMAGLRMTRAFLALRSHFSIVHLHGFSQKSILLVVLALVCRKTIAIKLTSFGDDDPLTMRRRGALTYWCFTRAATFFAVSPRFVESYAAAGLPAGRLHVVPNGVDTGRFRAADEDERREARRVLRLPETVPVVLFVGFFSDEKRPHLLFEAWRRMEEESPSGSVLLFVGATRSSYYEVDAAIADTVRARAAAAGLLDRVHFVDPVPDIERYYRAATLFVLPSVREGLPNVVLEAMASGLPVVATRLPGVTDTLVESDRTGLLVPADDPEALASAMRRIIAAPAWASQIGAAARRAMDSAYALPRVADRYFEVYRGMTGRVCAA